MGGSTVKYVIIICSLISAYHTEIMLQHLET